MSALDWVGIITGVVTIITAVYIAFKKFNQYLIKEYLSELKPNGGSSLADKVKLEILPMLIEIKSELAELRGRFDQHVVQHTEQTKD